MKKGSIFAGSLFALLIMTTAAAQSGHNRSHKNDAPDSITIPAGTAVKVELQNQIHSKLNEVGDEIDATLVNSIIVDGLVALKKGTEFRGRITQITAAKRPQRQASMTIVFDKIISLAGEYEVETLVKAIDDFENEDKLEAGDEGKVDGGRSGGRTVDNAIKGGKLGTLAGLPIIFVSVPVGVAIPGGVALGGVLLTKGNEIKLAPGTIFRIEITKPLTVPVYDDPFDLPDPRPRKSKGLKGN